MDVLRCKPKIVLSETFWIHGHTDMRGKAGRVKGRDGKGIGREGWGSEGKEGWRGGMEGRDGEEIWRGRMEV